ncbi:uncharacterized protein LTR77_007117 [Saxophila tyrrhenica]|uniref:DUF7907 domain-containing protein n=1 Tax=Saxophila tyrrhenica TaxID=1690608 RepID=A0AAV9P4J6_9PEZI|nr:hypothetical protein LTR77_007117 [Saxophila tyrrhenica]
MKLVLSAAAAVLSLASTASAGAKQSRPFYLVAVSHVNSINNTAFFACHEGAAIEGLCVAKKIPKTKPQAATYRLNNTNQNPNEGLLSYQLVAGNFKSTGCSSRKYHHAANKLSVVWEQMDLSTDVGSNVALPLFQPSDEGQQVGFDEHNMMYMKTYLNDMVTPPRGGKSRKLYRWYTCTTLYSSYKYHALAWVLGKSPPEVCIKREYRTVIRAASERV